VIGTQNVSIVNIQKIRFVVRLPFMNSCVIILNKSKICLIPNDNTKIRDMCECIESKLTSRF
jgi:hypothetical protein